MTWELLVLVPLLALVTVGLLSFTGCTLVHRTLPPAPSTTVDVELELYAAGDQPIDRVTFQTVPPAPMAGNIYMATVHPPAAPGRAQRAAQPVMVPSGSSWGFDVNVHIGGRTFSATANPGVLTGASATVDFELEVDPDQPGGFQVVPAAAPPLSQVSLRLHVSDAAAAELVSADFDLAGRAGAGAPVAGDASVPGLVSHTFSEVAAGTLTAECHCHLSDGTTLPASASVTVPPTPAVHDFYLEPAAGGGLTVLDAPPMPAMVTLELAVNTRAAVSAVSFTATAADGTPIGPFAAAAAAANQWDAAWSAPVGAIVVISCSCTSTPAAGSAASSPPIPIRPGASAVAFSLDPTPSGLPTVSFVHA